MATTDLKSRRAYDGTTYTVKVEDQVVYVKDDQANQTFREAFTLPSGAQTQVGFEVWPNDILEVIYVDASNTPTSVRSPDEGTTWA